MAAIYQINKGINKPIEFKGLKAQFITYLAIGLVILLVLFAVMYICGLNLFICVAIIVIAGTALFITIFRLSNKYGEYGLLKQAAKRYTPAFLKSRSLSIFFHLKTKGSNGTFN